VKRHLTATPALVKTYIDLFFNRRTYTLQLMQPHPESGRAAVIIRPLKCIRPLSGESLSGQFDDDPHVSAFLNPSVTRDARVARNRVLVGHRQEFYAGSYS
jgi:hypothetical protein